MEEKKARDITVFDIAAQLISFCDEVDRGCKNSENYTVKEKADDPFKR